MVTISILSFNLWNETFCIVTHMVLSINFLVTDRSSHYYFLQCIQFLSHLFEYGEHTLLLDVLGEDCQILNLKHIFAADDLISFSSVFIFIDGYGITRQMLCAGVPGTRLGGCHGDSGGPFVCKDSDGFWVLQGAVSWGSTDCNAQRMFTVFARVAVFREWINQYVKS